jgi:hypothetical protein
MDSIVVIIYSLLAAVKLRGCGSNLGYQQSEMRHDAFIIHFTT